MKLFVFYKWCAGTMNDFAKQFTENEVLYNQARAFWNSLDNIAGIIIALFVIIGSGMAAYYYKPYNDMPGRHYHPKHWLILLCITFVITLIVTLVIEYFFATPKLNGAWLVEVKAAFGNAVYASGMYFLISLFWCNFLPTNAYRLFKFI